MKEILPPSIIAIFALLVVAIAVPQAVISQKPVPVAVVNGKHLFNQSCSVCHDTRGASPKSGPELKNYYRHRPRPADATVRTIIQKGKGKMPGFSTFSKSQTDDLLAYLKTP